MATIDAQQLRALVGSLRASGDSRTAVAVIAEPIWTGPAVLDGDQRMRVVPCGSPLAVRAALAEHDPESELLAMLTTCSDADLGPDVLARLVKGRVVALDTYNAVASLFDATVLDPMLARHDRWLLDELIALAPPGGWPDAVAVAGVLDGDTAWSIWHRERLGLQSVPSTLTEVLALVADRRVTSELARLSPLQRERIASRWAGGRAPVGTLIELLAGDDVDDVVSLGLVAPLLWTATDDAALAQQQLLMRGRLEARYGLDGLDERSSVSWSAAAVELIEVSPTGHVWRDGAQQLLANGSGVLAVLSDELDSGFELRMEALAARLTDGDLSGAEAVLAALQRHRVGERRPRRLVTAQAAVRLLRRQSQPNQLTAGSFAAAVEMYRSEGAWIDEARRCLAEGDSSPQLTAAYRSLCDVVDVERASYNAEFARHLAQWSQSEPMFDDRMVPVESVLSDVVAPIAVERPVLVLICDGMGLGASHQLFDDLAAEGWAMCAPADQAQWPVGISMLPTITQVSRTALLTGQRIEGGQDQEKNAFATHPRLRDVTGHQLPPVLFHKGDLPGPTGHLLSEPVARAVADPDRRVVGVVVNAIDDHLTKGQQVEVVWGVSTIGPLAALLDAANEADRVIIVSSDHGHVLHDHHSRLLPAAEGAGERWRPVDGTLVDGEIEMNGPRVAKGGSVVLAVDESIRYAGHKHGYHGGANPQEVVVPVQVLARIRPEGWTYRPLERPWWWSQGEPQTPVVTAEPAPPRSTRRREAQDQITLFPAGDDAESTTSTTSMSPTIGAPGARPVVPWLDRFMSSPIFMQHRESVRLVRPFSDDVIVTLLGLIHANGGSIERGLLSQRFGEPEDRLRFTLTQLQRLLNIDGSAVISTDANGLVRLDSELLSLQFEVEIP